MLINPISTSDQVDVVSNPSIRLPRSARQQVSEASTLPETSEQGPNRSTESNTASGDTTVSNSITQAVEGEDTTDTAVTPTNPAPSPAVQRRLRQLHDLTRGVNEHTQRLYGCLERAQDAIYRRTPTPLSPVPTAVSAGTINAINPRHHGRAGSTVSSVNSISTPSNPSSVTREIGQNVKHKKENSYDQNKSLSSDTSKTKSSRELFVESNHFIKSILHISHFIKALSAEGFILPKYVKASMAELTTCARDLTLHLHFLSGPSPAPPNIGLNTSNLSSAPAAVHHNATLQQQQQRQ